MHLKGLFNTKLLSRIPHSRRSGYRLNLIMFKSMFCRRRESIRHLPACRIGDGSKGGATPSK